MKIFISTIVAMYSMLASAQCVQGNRVSSAMVRVFREAVSGLIEAHKDFDLRILWKSTCRPTV